MANNTYSYINKSGDIQDVEAPTGESAINRAAPTRAEHSGVITPSLLGSGRASTDSEKSALARANASPSGRINPDSFNTGSFDSYEGKFDLNQGDLNEISNRYASRLQSEMDLINAKYAPKITGQEELNRSSIARTKVLNANTGLVDSGTGATAVGRTEQKGNAALNAIQDEKNAALGVALGNVDALKQSSLEARSAQKRNDLITYNNLRAQNATKAQNTLKEYISAGGSLEKLKTTEPDSYKAFSDALGGDLAVESMAIGFQPKDTYVSDKPQIVGNKAIFFVKKADGTITQQSIDLPDTGKQIKTVTRVPGEGTYVFYNDGTHEVLGHGGTTGSASSKKTTPTGKKIVDGSLETSEDEIGQLASVLQTGAEIDGQKYNGTGPDGYVDPYLYKALYDKWRTEGGTPDGFAKQFPPAKYINPEASGIANLLPSFLQTKTKAGATANPF